MLKNILLFLLVFFSAYGANAQMISESLFTPLQSNYDRVSNEVEDALLLKLEQETFEEIFFNKPYRINLTIPTNNGSRASVTLERYEVLTPDAKGIEKTSGGEKEFSLRDLVVSYTGTVNGMDESLVSLNFSINGVNGVMMTSVDRFVIGRMENMGENAYLLFRESKIKMKNNFACSTSDDIPESVRQIMSGITGDMRGLSDEILQANIALDIDRVTYVRFGSSVSNASAYAISLLSTSSILYLREMNVKLSVPYINVWSTADPYTGTSSNSILTQFRSYWNANQQGVSRTLAHLISTRTGGLGGIAYVDVLCASLSNGSGYGFSNTNGGFSQIPTYSWDVDVISHELGHNFGSPHTHNCSWTGGPIDTCYAIEGNCYNGSPRPKTGTIMSYCHLTANKKLEFGPLPRQLIRSRTESASCITHLTDRVILAYPNGGEVLRTYRTEKIIWGSGFTGNVNIELSTNNGVNWTTIQNNVPSTQNEYDWTLPNMDSTLQAKIRVYDSQNSSFGDTSDAVFEIHKNLTMAGLALHSPATWTRIYTDPADTSTARFIWRKAGFHPSITYKWSVKKIGGSTEYFYPSDNSGIDTSVSLRKSFLDSLARITLGFTGDSVLCVWRSWAYNGYDSASSNIYIISFAENSVGINTISAEIPGEFKLHNNYPNPFNPETVINFALPNSAYVKLIVYDYLGREITKLVNDNLSPGIYSADFNTSLYQSLSSGVYFYRIIAEYGDGVYSDTKRMILLK